MLNLKRVDYVVIALMLLLAVLDIYMYKAFPNPYTLFIMFIIVMQLSNANELKDIKNKVG